MKNVTVTIEKIKEFIRTSIGDATAVIGISGGKDSLVCAKLLVDALGADKVVGLFLPDGEQKDIKDAYKSAEVVGITHTIELNLKNITEAFKKQIEKAFNTFDLSQVLTTNLGARVRMIEMYNVAAQIGNARVINTDNKSENYIGYYTKWGNVGDISILSDLTVTEVREIGDALGLPYELVHKAPSDGLCGLTDEERNGFTYDELDNYLMTGSGDQKLIDCIEAKHNATYHKRKPVPFYKNIY